MRFHITLANLQPNDRPSAFSLVDWIRQGLTDLGHEATSADDTVRSDATNLFFEQFFPGDVATLAGIDYGVIATEWTEGGIWNRNDADPYWQARWLGFREVAQRARFTWCLVPESVPHIPRAALLELGWVPAFERASLPDTYDFFHHGSLTEDRMTILNELGKRGHRIAMPVGLASPAHLDRLIGASRINLNLRTTSTFPIPSVGRIGHVLHLNRLAISEWAPSTPTPADLVPMCPQGVDFVDFAEHQLATYDPHFAELAVDAYRQRPMTRCLERALDLVH